MGGVRREAGKGKGMKLKQEDKFLLFSNDFFNIGHNSMHGTIACEHHAMCNEI